MLNKKITLESIPEPQVFEHVAPTFLNAETIAERKQKLLQRMSEENFEALVIYADKEHASNFEYLTGFIPRFEEGLLVVERPEKFTLILGNENLKLCAHARVSADLIHYPQFSLPRIKVNFSGLSTTSRPSSKRGIKPVKYSKLLACSLSA